jgi:hypothetical protein
MELVAYRSATYKEQVIAMGCDFRIVWCTGLILLTVECVFAEGETWSLVEADWLRQVEAWIRFSPLQKMEVTRQKKPVGYCSMKKVK